MGRGAWWAAVHGVSKSRTRLSNFTFTFHFSSIAEYLKQKNESMSWKINWCKYLSEGSNKVKRMKRTEDSLRDLWDHVKYTNVQIIGVPEEEWQPTPVF